MGNDLRATVHAQVSGRWIELEQLLDRVNHINSSASPTYTNCQADAFEFINHVEELEHAAIHCLIELEVDRPDVVRVLGSQQFP